METEIDDNTKTLDTGTFYLGHISHRVCTSSGQLADGHNIEWRLIDW